MRACLAVAHRFRWLFGLLVLLACIPDQGTILAPVLPDSAMSAAGGEGVPRASLLAIDQPVSENLHLQTPQDQLAAAMLVHLPYQPLDDLATTHLPEQENPVPVGSRQAGEKEAILVKPSTSDTSTSTVPSLRLVFPEQTEQLNTDRRPPLYPVPWAKAPQDHFYFLRPILSDEIQWPLWEYRYGGMFFEDVVHTGLDIPARVGTPVVAAGSGKVVWAGPGLYRGVKDLDDPYGLAIAILHDFGYQGESLFTVYGHLDRINVAYGQRVEAGELIGLSGETGKVTGPHLHFEVRIGKNGFFSTRNPELWLAPPQGWGVLAGRVMNTGGLLVSEQEIQLVSMSSSLKLVAKTYGPESVNSDPYYQENIVISDLPAGIYEIRIAFGGVLRKQQIEIKTGLVSFFTFQGYRSFGPPEPPLTPAEFPFLP